jgi:hypothetical protein
MPSPAAEAGLSDKTNMKTNIQLALVTLDQSSPASPILGRVYRNRQGEQVTIVTSSSYGGITTYLGDNNTWYNQDGTACGSPVESRHTLIEL